MRFHLCTLSLMVLITSQLAADEPQGIQLADEAYRILKDRCARCHGGSARQAGLDVLSRDALLERRGSTGSEFSFIVPGKAEESILIDSVDGGTDSYMPKEGSPEAKAMTDDEKDLLARWVEAGAPFPRVENRPFVGNRQILKAMRSYLFDARDEDRLYLRFYTLTHLHNNPNVSEMDLRLYRAALSKAVNSLSKERKLYLPRSLEGTDESVYVIDLREVGWDRDNKWNQILKEYPYGLKYDFVRDEDLKQLWKDVSQLSGADLPFLRADWFIVTATQPPLYHILLDIPDELMELEHNLQLDIRKNFLEGRIERSGFAKSGVSKQNRLLERHTSPVTPYFWISYDFLPKRARGDLVRFPLGPQSPQNPFNEQAFDHDGGEIIWSLPNGMQAYMLVDAKGARIDQGPIDVVFDRSAVLGTPAIINGISCMYCHRDGMISEFRDELRLADAIGGRAREHLLDIHPPHEEMQRSTQNDKDIFLRSLNRAIGPYLLTGKDQQKSVSDFPEPIGKVAEMYSRDLSPEELALELGIEKLETLQSTIAANRQLLRFGLGTMIQDPPGTLKREKWETRDGTSLMQDVAYELGRGMPFVP